MDQESVPDIQQPGSEPDDPAQEAADEAREAAERARAAARQAEAAAAEAEAAAEQAEAAADQAYDDTGVETFPAGEDAVAGDLEGESGTDPPN